MEKYLMPKKYTHNIQLLLLLFSFVECSPKMNINSWLPTECAPAKYPMTIIKGDLIDGVGKHTAIPDGKILNNGWGELGSTFIMNETNTTVPAKLDIEWFSYAENKFYKGTFDLPADTIAQYFKEGFISPDTKTKQEFDCIKIGVAPGGYISVWVSGENITKEIITLQAKEDNYDWNVFFDNPDISREKYVESTLREALTDSVYQTFKTQKIIPDFWQRYNEKFNWKPQVFGLLNAYDILIKTFNGEQEFFFDQTKSQSKRAVIRSFELHWTATSNKKYMANTTFDEDEIYAAFKKISDTFPDEPIQLKVEISNTDFSLRISLVNSRQCYELKKCITQVYSN
ncbi:hypothetical protein BH09BAC5_BH09BAC5_29150 [soil metagenome]